MGRWSKRLAPLFLDFAGINDGERVLDVGCGTGSLTFAITERSNIGSIEAIDFEEQFVEALRQKSNDPRIVARQGDACALFFEDQQFDRALSLLVLHFVSDPAKAISEMRRVVRPGGVEVLFPVNINDTDPLLAPSRHIALPHELGRHRDKADAAFAASGRRVCGYTA